MSASPDSWSEICFGNATTEVLPSRQISIINVSIPLHAACSEILQLFIVCAGIAQSRQRGVARRPWKYCVTAILELSSSFSPCVLSPFFVKFKSPAGAVTRLTNSCYTKCIRLITCLLLACMWIQLTTCHRHRSETWSLA